MQSTTTTIFDLPPEIIEMILDDLRLPDIANLAKSSTTCNGLAKNLGCTLALLTPKRTKIADEYQKISREIPYGSFR